jgi:hypothetical protein
LRETKIENGFLKGRVFGPKKEINLLSVHRTDCFKQARPLWSEESGCLGQPPKKYGLRWDSLGLLKGVGGSLQAALGVEIGAYCENNK